MSEKKLGVLGGMGPLATSVFFEQVVLNTDASNDQEHIDMLILNHASLPDRTTAILTGEDDKFLKEVKEDLKLFEAYHVDNIVIPCNTSHFFYDQIQAMTQINIINMVEQTINQIRRNDGLNSRVAILATDGTILSRVYEDECLKQSIEPFIPVKEMQSKIMKIIYHIKSDANYLASELNEIIRKLIKDDQCTSVILGCTELSCVKLDENIAQYCVDPLKVLVKEAIIHSDKTFKKSIND